MKVDVLKAEEFRKIVLDRYQRKNRTENLKDLIHYFNYSDFDTYLSPKTYLDTLRFVVAYNDTDVMGVAKFAFYEMSKNYSISYVSTNDKFFNQGVSKALLNKIFEFFHLNYPNEVLHLTGYSISGWKYLRKYVLKFSEEFEVEIKESPVEFITKWDDEAHKLFDESRKVLNYQRY